MDIIPQDTSQKQCSKCDKPFPATSQFFVVKSAHKDGLASQCKQCDKKRREENAEELRIGKQQYYNDHKEQHALRSRNYQKTHPEGCKRRRQKYEKAHPDRSRAKCHKRRAIKKSAPGFYIAKDVQTQYERQKGKCYWCSKKLGAGKRAYHVDHVIPLTRGGSNWPDNIVLACPHCNTSRSDLLPHEWPEGGRLL